MFLSTLGAFQDLNIYIEPCPTVATSVLLSDHIPRPPNTDILPKLEYPSTGVFFFQWIWGTALLQRAKDWGMLFLPRALSLIQRSQHLGILHFCRTRRPPRLSLVHVGECCFPDPLKRTTRSKQYQKQASSILLRFKSAFETIFGLSHSIFGSLCGLAQGVCLIVLRVTASV